MFQIPVSESKDRSQATRTVPKPDSRREQHPHSYAGPYSRAVSPGATLHRQHLAGLQSMIGNQAVLRLMNNPKSAMQTKLVVNEPGNQHGQEANRVAEQVMKGPRSIAQRTCISCGSAYNLHLKSAACEGQETAGIQRKRCQIRD